ncbi:methionine ABC transporter ATP-binding protein [Dyella caseinilytica]|uniref:Methionine ABC transporter ATP-binding protein n=1 Tax=Dyella caseinilytica TaxID=1849581 RepID=A0ABX7GPW6_9GAMM|nr:methionine ABC transporter ATP-binding protein [Dyella caseinilytica]QRN52466.1 methionine ABC transporter ATP-binding protein [Dyella caseinilytica]GGA06268.1 methionine import ATP-binding protein MetN 2 [Dyella caseinilytica]
MIRFVDVHKSYRVNGKDIPALEPFSLEIADGEVFGIIGHSGAGKSTLIRLINLLERPSGGHILIGDTDITTLPDPALRAARQRIGMIFQHFNLLSSQTVTENIAFPMRLAGDKDAATIHKRVDELLQRVGLQAHANKYPSQLSGGQKQRVGIARALANQPSILLCDEATSALDPQTTASVLELLAEINRELKLTIVLITHEMDVVRRVCDRVAVLDAGRIVEYGSVADVFLHPQHPTTRRFVNEALPEEAAGEHVPYQYVPGRIMRLSFRGEATWSPTLGRVTRETGVDYNILAGRIDRIKDLPYGQLTLAMQGENVDRALQALRDAGIEVEELAR